ncbi:MAG: hypothetical protein EBU81_14500, partial [Proteobacteria bacterium]|nr:hypothetical protein [Pseudomonadota bacterium]
SRDSGPPPTAGHSLSGTMVTGHLAIVLHAHLPWVRHPEHDRFLEEYWLFEAVAECYLPLLRVLRGWIRDEVDWKLTLGITPTLAAMWADPLLKARTQRYLVERRELARLEIERTVLVPGLNAVARFHAEFYEEVWSEWTACDGDLIAAWAGMARTGRLELLGGPATHPTWQSPSAVEPGLAGAPTPFRGASVRPVAAGMRMGSGLGEAVDPRRGSTLRAGDPWAAERHATGAHRGVPPGPQPGWTHGLRSGSDQCPPGVESSGWLSRRPPIPRVPSGSGR